MKLLLDTHALVWWVLDDHRLSRAVDGYLSDPDVDVFVSAATAWELTTKYRSGRLAEAVTLIENLPAVIKRCRFEALPVTVEHGHRAGLLPGSHKDPFDRMIAAQAIVEDFRVATVDPALSALGAAVVW